MSRRAWLVRTTGSLSGTRYAIESDVTRIGRGPGNDVLIEDDAAVSTKHCEVRRDGDLFTILDLESTNGTYVNGMRVTRTSLDGPCSIQLGPKGPHLAFLFGDEAGALNATVRVDSPTVLTNVENDDVVAEAMARRKPKWHPKREDTVTIMRRAVRKAVERSRRNLRRVIAVLVLALIGLGGFTAWRVVQIRQEKASLDKQIREVEELLSKAAEDPRQADEMVEKLDRFEGAAKQLTGSLLYRWSAQQEKRNPVEDELKSLFADFGAETYTIPPDLLAHVEREVQRLQGPDRQKILDAFGRAKGDLKLIRDMFRQDNLPPDLAYMTVVESAVSAVANPASGAAGPWQLMPPTARAMGLRVDGQVDERMDVRKSTQAARKIIRELILDFGSGGSVMLAVAAYNSGTSRVKQAVRTVRDPIKQRNFWYLYRTRALPQETRDYVPKVLAVLIIARAPQRFGFTV